MRRPWQVWLLFAAGLAVVIPAMIWLSLQVLYLDQAEALSRRQAEREEVIGRALWRMDSLITPLLAREAARPDVYYETVLTSSTGGKVLDLSKLSAEDEVALDDFTRELEKKNMRQKDADGTQCLSPLVADPPDYVKLYFNWLPDNRVVSPQCPKEEERGYVYSHGVTDQELNVYESRRQQLEISSTNGSLLAMLPAESFPVSRWDYLPEETAQEQQRLPVPTQQARVPQQAMQQPQGVPQQLAPPQPVAPTNAPEPPQSGDLINGQAPPPPVVASQPAASSGTTNYFGQPPTSNSFTASGPETAERQQSQSESPYGNRRGQQTQNSRTGRAYGKDDYDQRISAYENFAQQSVESFKSRNPDGINIDEVASITPHREGAFRPVWINGKLLFARRVQKGDQTLVQGCWLDWDRIERLLREEVSDILPRFLLVPVFEPRQAAFNRVLATLPVQIEVPPLQPQSIQWTPVRLALVAAWAGLLLASLAAAITLQGMIILNERRASFVSAVTHELRTPLTTFRMYAEMLAEGMVPDPLQQKKYLTTLRTESDRLAHLVDNVLQYARLERGRPGKQRQQILLGALLDRVESRLADRAQQAGLVWQLEGNTQLRKMELSTDPAAIEQILFNLVDNAGKYAAHSEDKRLHLSWKLEPRALALRVIDHGPGIGTQGRPRLFLPFSKSVNEAAESAPGVGLGLALSRRLARALGGELTWEQTPGGGATFCLRLPRV